MAWVRALETTTKFMGVSGGGGLDGVAMDAGDYGGGRADRTHGRVGGAFLGPGVPFVEIFLEVEGDGEAVGSMEEWGGVVGQLALGAPELEVSQGEEAGAAADGDFGVLAGSHGEEEA